MKLTRGLFLAVFTSVILALMLSILPTVELGDLNNDSGISVFKPMERPLVLRQNNVADVLLTTSYHLKIHRIDWSNSILTVDFTVDLPFASKSDVYLDFWKTVFLGLKQTTNVNEVHTRVYVVSGQNQKELAVAMVARRSNLPSSIQWQQNDAGILRTQIESMFDITYKSKWMDIP